MTALQPNEVLSMTVALAIVALSMVVWYKFCLLSPHERSANAAARSSSIANAAANNNNANVADTSSSSSSSSSSNAKSKAATPKKSPTPTQQTKRNKGRNNNNNNKQKEEKIKEDLDVVEQVDDDIDAADDLTRLDDESDLSPPSLSAPTVTGVSAQDEQALFVAGVRAFQSANVDAAIDLFSQVIALDDTACDAFYYRGACHYHRKDSLATIADYETLTRLAPAKATYWSCLGDAYMNLTDELGEALRCYARCIEIDSTFAAAHFNRGMCRYKMKQYDAALIDIERALNIEPHNANYINGARDMREKLAHYRAQASAAAADDDDGLDGLGDEDPLNRDDDDDDDDDEDGAAVARPLVTQQRGAAAASVTADEFASAVKRVGQTKVPLSNDHKLQIYALFKQASQGKCSTPQPSLINFTERAKWNAWNELGDMSRDEARARYVHMADTLCGAEAVAAAKASGAKPAVDAREKNFGIGVSRPVEDSAAGGEAKKDVCFYASVGDLKHVVELVDAGTYEVDHSDGERRTPLIWAADRGHAELCKALLERGADVNAQDDDGQTALHYAAMCGHIEIVRVLLSAENVDRGLCDNEGQAPYDVAEGTVKALLS